MRCIGWWSEELFAEEFTLMKFVNIHSSAFNDMRQRLDSMKNDFET